jgi:hypothetical protein
MKADLIVCNHGCRNDTPIEHAIYLIKQRDAKGFF